MVDAVQRHLVPRGDHLVEQARVLAHPGEQHEERRGRARTVQRLQDPVGPAGSGPSSNVRTTSGWSVRTDTADPATRPTPLRTVRRAASAALRAVAVALIAVLPRTAATGGRRVRTPRRRRRTRRRPCRRPDRPRAGRGPGAGPSAASPPPPSAPPPPATRRRPRATARARRARLVPRDPASRRSVRTAALPWLHARVSTHVRLSPLNGQLVEDDGPRRTRPAGHRNGPAIG